MDIGDSKVLAWVDKIGGNKIFIIEERVKIEDLENIMLHEIGHILGARHVGKTLMNSKYNKYYYTCIDQITASQIGAFLGLDVDNLNYCFKD